MTIASAFNEIAVAQGGTASSSGTIAGAIDALTDALAGSDVQSPDTIEGAVRLLGEHIGGGGSFGNPSEVMVTGAGYFSVEAGMNGARICSVTLPDEGAVSLAGGLTAQIWFDDTPSGTPTATFGQDTFTDFTYEDGGISFTVPDGGEDEPTLAFLFN